MAQLSDGSHLTTHSLKVLCVTIFFRSFSGRINNDKSYMAICLVFSLLSAIRAAVSHLVSLCGRT
jgi:hypothetical protein